MDYFGINSPDDLPKIREVLNQEIIEATKIEAIQNELPVEAEVSEEDTQIFLTSDSEATGINDTVSE